MEVFKRFLNTAILVVFILYGRYLIDRPFSDLSTWEKPIEFIYLIILLLVIVFSIYQIIEYIIKGRE